MKKLWGLIFAVWAVFLSGSLSQFVATPGVIQAVQLKSLLDSKLKQESDLQDAVIKLQADAESLEKDRVVQHREIRRVLGYAASDELIFDFSTGEKL